MPNVNKVEAITFSVGVEQAYNHLDPASFPPDDPLAPQNPEMHWGWVSGYRFAAVEGEAGPNLDQHFEIHSIGDANTMVAFQHWRRLLIITTQVCAIRLLLIF